MGAAIRLDDQGGFTGRQRLGLARSTEDLESRRVVVEVGAFKVEIDIGGAQRPSGVTRSDDIDSARIVLCKTSRAERRDIVVDDSAVRRQRNGAIVSLGIDAP